MKPRRIRRRTIGLAVLILTPLLLSPAIWLGVRLAGDVWASYDPQFGIILGDSAAGANAERGRASTPYRPIYCRRSLTGAAAEAFSDGATAQFDTAESPDQRTGGGCRKLEGLRIPTRRYVT